jgi:hypothetical protein
LPQLVRLVKDVAAIDKSAIGVPTLMIYSPADRVIDPAAVADAFAEWGGERKRLVAFERSGDPSQHVLAGGHPVAGEHRRACTDDQLPSCPGSRIREGGAGAAGVAAQVAAGSRKSRA